MGGGVLWQKKENLIYVAISLPMKHNIENENVKLQTEVIYVLNFHLLPV